VVWKYSNKINVHNNQYSGPLSNANVSNFNLVYIITTLNLPACTSTQKSRCQWRFHDKFVCTCIFTPSTLPSQPSWHNHSNNIGWRVLYKKKVCCYGTFSIPQLLCLSFNQIFFSLKTLSQTHSIPVHAKWTDALNQFSTQWKTTSYPYNPSNFETFSKVKTQITDKNSNVNLPIIS
jgi:hypothetical protein